MTRDELIDLVHCHRPSDDTEAGSRKQILDFLSEPGNLFDRKRFAPGHLTGSAFILDAPGKSLLLVHHARLDRWLQPGGHGEPGETDPLAIAAREALEETGVPGLVLHPAHPAPFDLDVHEIPARKDEPAHLHLDIRYLFVAPAGARPAASAESKGIAWRPLPELSRKDTDPSLRRAAVKLPTMSRRTT